MAPGTRERVEDLLRRHGYQPRPSRTPRRAGLIDLVFVNLGSSWSMEILAGAEARVKSAGLSVETELIESPAVRVCDQVVDEARRWRAELIVIGTHGRRGVGRLMIGSEPLALRATLTNTRTTAAKPT